LPRTRKAWTRIVTLGLLAAVFQAGYFASVAHLSLSLATLITIGSAPALVMLLERRTDRRSLATLALALAGLTLLVGFVPRGDVAGAVVALVSAAGFATLTVVAKRPVDGLDDIAATGFGFVIGAAALAPAADLAFAPDPAALGLLIALGVGPTAIAYAAYFRGLRTATAGTAALMSLLEPLVGTALAVIVLGDRLDPAGVAGAALLVSALTLESRARSGTAPRCSPAPGTSPRDVRPSPEPRPRPRR
jgi:drug/metabolite transporter, DME family